MIVCGWREDEHGPGSGNETFRTRFFWVGELSAPVDSGVRGGASFISAGEVLKSGQKLSKLGCHSSNLICQQRRVLQPRFCLPGKKNLTPRNRFIVLTARRMRLPKRQHDAGQVEKLPFPDYRGYRAAETTPCNGTDLSMKNWQWNNFLKISINGV